jgi:hypothetical protein
MLFHEVTGTLARKHHRSLCAVHALVLHLRSVLALLVASPKFCVVHVPAARHRDGIAKLVRGHLNNCVVRALVLHLRSVLALLVASPKFCVVHVLAARHRDGIAKLVRHRGVELVDGHRSNFALRALVLRLHSVLALLVASLKFCVVHVLAARHRDVEPVDGHLHNDHESRGHQMDFRHLFAEVFPKDSKHHCHEHCFWKQRVGILPCYENLGRAVRGTLPWLLWTLA